MKKLEVFKGKQMVKPVFLLLSVLFLATVTYGQEGNELPKLVLREIIHGSSPAVDSSYRAMPPDKVEVSANSGIVEFKREKPSGNFLSFRFTYKFERDMNILEFSSEYPYEINLVPLSGSPDFYAWARAQEAQSTAYFQSHLMREKQWKYLPMYNAIDKTSPKIRGHKATPTTIVGPLRAEFVTSPYSSDKENSGKFTQLNFSINAQGVNNNGFSLNVIFVYEEVWPDDQADDGTGSGGGTTGSGGGMLLEAEKREVASGESVLVPVWLKNAADVANMNFTISYDPSVANLESELTKGNLLSNALFSSNPRQSGLIRVGLAQTSGLSGTGTVAYLPFKAVGRPGSRTPLRLAVTTINNPGGAKLNIQRINGSIAIINPKDRVQGDCDGDGQLTELDALCALQMSVQLIQIKRVMDFDTDGDVTSRDAVIILQRAIGRL